MSQVRSCRVLPPLMQASLYTEQSYLGIYVLVGKLKNDVRQLNNMFNVPKFPMIYVARLCLLPVSCFCQEIAYLQLAWS